MIAALVLVFLALGLFFQLVAAVGFVRLPDVYSRLHVTCITDTLGAPLVLVAAAIWTGLGWTAAKLLLAVVFLYLTSPLVGHLLSRAALEAGLRPAGADPARVPARERRKTGVHARP